jgi:hypothetical protein
MHCHELYYGFLYSEKTDMIYFVLLAQCDEPICFRNYFEQKILDDWGIRLAILCSYAWRGTMITQSFTPSSRHSWCKEVIWQGQEQVKWDWFVVVSCNQSHCVAVHCGKSCNQRFIVMLSFDDYYCMMWRFECEEQVGIPCMEDHLLMRYIHDCDSITGVWLLVPMLALRT